MGDVQKEKESKGVSQYIKIIVYMVIGLVAIFFVLPTTIIFLVNIFPDWFHNEAAVNALKSLHDNLYDGIALVSLFVGVFSIWYAWSSSKTVEKQSEKQEAVLQNLQHESATILREVTAVKERMAIISERRVDLRYTTPREPKAADEAR
jgi:flagellar basal body-associated protein FliL